VVQTRLKPTPRSGQCLRQWQLIWQYCLPIILALILLGAAPPAFSQTEGAAPATQTNPDATAPAAAADTPNAAPSYSSLADLLEDETARKQLIEQLRGLANTPAAAPAGTPAADPIAEDDSISHRIATSTQMFVQGIAADFSEAIATFQTLGRGEGVRGISMQRWLTALTSMAIVVAATLIAYLLFRAIASRAYARLDAWVARPVPPPVVPPAMPSGSPDATPHAGASDAAAMPPPVPPAATTYHTGRKRAQLAVTPVYRYVGAMLGALCIDIGVILLAAIVGYAVGVYGGETGEIGTLESMFVNAFVAVEIAKALVRTVFATRYQHLRLIPMADDIAVYWNGWLSRLISITGYGILIVVPVLRAMFSPAIGQVVGLVLMIGVYIYAVRVIWTNRKLLRERLERQANVSSTAFFSTLIRMLARVWHIPAIAYFTVLLVVSQIAPTSALPFMARATLQTLIAVGIGLALSALLSAWLKRRIVLSEGLQTKLPMLEVRLNSYVPATLKTLRTLLLILVVLVVLDGWQAFDLADWVTSESGSATIGTIIHVGIILFFAALAWTLIASVIEHRLNTTPDRAPSARERTLLSLFRNAALIVILTMTVLIVLSQIGINIAPLIAGAGVVGLAIGFGAQKLVQDIITGIFIQIENGMNQNDVVEAAGVFGTVEKITIRSVGIRTLDGGYHMIPFSSVDTVVNHMRDFSYHLGEYTIAHRESVDDAIFHLERAFDELKQDAVLAPEILEDITIPGVTSLSEKGFTVRVLIKTTPGMQWAVQRGYNRLVKKHFNAANIELPYPHTVVYFGQDKKGHAPSVGVHTATEQSDFSAGDAPGAGQMHRPLTRPKPASTEVLGNELDPVVDEEGKPLDDDISKK